MGWNDWNAFGCNVSASLVEQTATAMVNSGLAAAGYKFVNIDDCWMAGNGISRQNASARAAAGRDAITGALVPDPTNFPDGIKAVADYVHARGLKLGIYESAGWTTCQGLAGSYGHELTDARTFAAWGVDYLKYDNCGTVAGTADNQAEYIARYKAMGDALLQASTETGHPIVYSVCEWGNYAPWSWAADQAEANLWRTTSDISDNWASTVSLFKQNVILAPYAHPGAWNDPDMLEIGNGGQTDTEYRSQFSLWSMMAAPLIDGSALAQASQPTLKILENAEVVSIDQDSLGQQATVYSHAGMQWILTRHLANGDVSLLFFNESPTPTTQSVSLSSGLASSKSAYLVRDIWAHQDGTVADTLHTGVAGHGVAMFRISAGATPAGAPQRVTLAPTATSTYVEAGTSARVSGSVLNDGRNAITNVSVSLTRLPSGWSVSPVNVAAKAVPGQSSTSSDWTLTLPSGTTPGAYALDLSSSYQATGGTAETAMATLDLIVPPAPPRIPVYLSELAWVSQSGTVYLDKQVITSFGPGGSSSTTYPITLGGTTYAKGLGTAAGSDVQYYLGGHCTTLSALAGVDDNALSFGTPSAEMRVIVDGVTVFDQTIAKGSPVTIDQNITSAKVIDLNVAAQTGFGPSTPADWANAHVTCA